MAIYGDGKHNENMEHNSPNFQIADKTTYKTIVWTIESEDETYIVRCIENDIYDEWQVESETDGILDNENEIASLLIYICEHDD
jgi:hypothetical protein